MWCNLGSWRTASQSSPPHSGTLRAPSIHGDGPGLSWACNATNLNSSFQAALLHNGATQEAHYSNPASSMQRRQHAHRMCSDPRRYLKLLRHLPCYQRCICPSDLNSSDGNSWRSPVKPYKLARLHGPRLPTAVRGIVDMVADDNCIDDDNEQQAQRHQQQHPLQNQQKAITGTTCAHLSPPQQQQVGLCRCEMLAAHVQPMHATFTLCIHFSEQTYHPTFPHLHLFPL